MAPCGVAYPQLQIRCSFLGLWPRRWIHDPFRERWTEGAAAGSPRRRDDRGGASPSLSCDTSLASDERALAAGLPRSGGRAVWPLVRDAAVVGRAAVGRPGGIARWADRRAFGGLPWFHRARDSPLTAG